MKICKTCNEELTLDRFVKRAQKSGIGTVCRSCVSEDLRRRREYASNWKYPYKGLKDPKYISDRNEFFGKLNAKRRADLFHNTGVV